MDKSKTYVQKYKAGNAIIDRLLEEHYPEDKDNLYMVNGPNGRKPVVVPPEGGGVKGVDTPRDKAKEALEIYEARYKVEYHYYCDVHDTSTVGTKAPGCCKYAQRVGEVNTKDNKQDVVE